MIHIYHLPYRRDLKQAKPWPAAALSVFVHASLVAVLFGSVDWPPRPEPHRDTSHLRKAMKLLLPKREVPQSATRQAVAGARLAAATTATTLPQPALKLDLSAIQISFADDVSNQLPDVINQQNGVLAFLEKKDPTYADYVAEPPDWNVRAGFQDVSGKTRLSMTPPDKWTLVLSIAQAHSISLSDYQVSALFESSYAACLLDAIRKKVLADPRAVSQSVRSARLGFASSSPCGVDVLDISFGGRLQNP